MLKNGVTWNYTYNNAGLRTGRTGGGTTYQYVYNGGQLMQMTKDGQAVYFTYDASGKPLTMKVYTETEENGTAVTRCDTYYYVINLQGDVMALVKVTDEGIETAASYSYTAYGVVTATGDATVIALNPLTYRGYVYDTETELYYLQSRYYDPAIGRFINADAFVSTGQGLLGNNMFAYCGNNPVIGCDPCGRCIHYWYLLGIKDCDQCGGMTIEDKYYDVCDTVAYYGECIDEFFYEQKEAAEDWFADQLFYAQCEFEYQLEKIQYLYYDAIDYLSSEKFRSDVIGVGEIIKGLGETITSVCLLAAPEPTGWTKVKGVAGIIDGAASIAFGVCRLMGLIDEE